MANDADIEVQLKSLSTRTAEVNKIKASVQGREAVLLKQLEELMQEITAEGYDPKNLLPERDRLKQELLQEMAVYNEALTKTEEAVAPFK